MNIIAYFVAAVSLIMYCFSSPYRAKCRERWKQTPTHRVVYEIGGGIIGLGILGAIAAVIAVRYGLQPYSKLIIAGLLIGFFAIVSLIRNREILGGMGKGKYDKPESERNLNALDDSARQVRSDSAARKLCVSCGERIPKNTKICPKCGWTQPA